MFSSQMFTVRMYLSNFEYTWVLGDEFGSREASNGDAHGPFEFAHLPFLTPDATPWLLTQKHPASGAIDIGSSLISEFAKAFQCGCIWMICSFCSLWDDNFIQQLNQPKIQNSPPPLSCYCKQLNNAWHDLSLHFSISFTVPKPVLQLQSSGLERSV